MGVDTFKRSSLIDTVIVQFVSTEFLADVKGQVHLGLIIPSSNISTT